jgi:hypothetical protein
VKLPLVQHHQPAIYCNASYGPTFGAGSDLRVANCADMELLYRASRRGRYAATYGPTFGGGHQHDLHVANSANINNNSYTNFGHTYQLPPGQSAAQTFFTGGRHFQADEVAVYQVQLQ